jgi:hypothetical protein
MIPSSSLLVASAVTPFCRAHRRDPCSTLMRGRRCAVVCPKVTRYHVISVPKGSRLPRFRCTTCAAAGRLAATSEAYYSPAERTPRHYRPPPPQIRSRGGRRRGRHATVCRFPAPGGNGRAVGGEEEENADVGSMTATTVARIGSPRWRTPTGSTFVRCRAAAAVSTGGGHRGQCNHADRSLLYPLRPATSSLSCVPDGQPAGTTTAGAGAAA